MGKQKETLMRQVLGGRSDIPIGHQAMDHNGDAYITTESGAIKRVIPKLNKKQRKKLYARS